MDGKKAATKFTIQFSRTDPSHLLVADILNGLERHGKAQYIVEAVLCYENRKEDGGKNLSTAIDEKRIEAVVKRLLRERDGSGTGNLPAAVPVGLVENTTQIGDVVFEDTADDLGADDLNVVAGALDMFRRK